LHRIEHVQQLNYELSITKPDPLELTELHEWALLLENEKKRKELEEAELKAEQEVMVGCGDKWMDG